MPKHYEQFRYSDWKWIVDNFQRADQREDIARAVWLITQCSADEIVMHKKLDPRIVIPLCAIEFQDEFDWQKLKISKKDIKQIDEEDFLKLLNYVSNSTRWKTLVLSLEYDLQRELIYRLSNSYRRLNRNDWRFYFANLEYEFTSSWHYRLILAYTFLLIVFCIITMNTIILTKHSFWIYSFTGLALYILIGFWVSSLLIPKYFIKFGLFGFFTFTHELYQLLSNKLINSDIDLFVNNIVTEAVIGTVAGTLILGMGATDAKGTFIVAATVAATFLSATIFSIGIGALMGKVSWGMALIMAVTGILILAGAGIVAGTGTVAGASTIALAVNVAVFIVVVGVGVGAGGGAGISVGNIRLGMALFLAGVVIITEAGVLFGTSAGAITLAIIGILVVFILGVGALFRRISWIWVMAVTVIGTLILARVVAGVNTLTMVAVRLGILIGVLLSIGKLSWYGRKYNQNYFQYSRFLAILTLPLFFWFPILVSFTTIFFLRFLSWQYTLLVWLISLGLGTVLWLYGQNKERLARNPLKDILPLNNYI
ncbi:hypothetical protein [Nostoc sp. ATCC 53789]|uniref:hypothetical protein n=1 Tax=unclassified Nostoc TaxID=2593658 RepID=UPI000DEC20C6|nr:hypothetical protein [Nostoc sp. ATCC 53789]QHG20793.1 hypothetical protein GJB62_33475 [Nostoc sp. ATCC 53789]RCJ25234.1 hypothetical protein A6V25_21280 [Nostoc sp. ATCC 53789]